MKNKGKSILLYSTYFYLFSFFPVLYANLNGNFLAKEALMFNELKAAVKTVRSLIVPINIKWKRSWVLIIKTKFRKKLNLKKEMKDELFVPKRY